MHVILSQVSIMCHNNNYTTHIARLSDNNTKQI